MNDEQDNGPKVVAWLLLFAAGGFVLWVMGMAAVMGNVTH